MRVFKATPPLVVALACASAPAEKTRASTGINNAGVLHRCFAEIISIQNFAAMRTRWGAAEK
jgi:hypothetical protein